MKYAVVIETTATGFSAYVPDLPGCVTTGSSVDEVEREIQEAIRFHLDGLREDGIATPQPTTLCQYVEMSA
jgi:predicted RNase H-like HicB family nuclease